MTVDGTTTLYLGRKTGTVRVTLYTLDGNKVWDRTSYDVTKVSLPMEGRFAPGLYLEVVRIVKPDDKVKTYNRDY